MDKKYIRFIDTNYNDLFHVEDGHKVRVNRPDGSAEELVCKYIDPYHAQVGYNHLHIFQFAEIMERFGNTYEPVDEIGDLDFYEKHYSDRLNTKTDGTLISYYDLMTVKKDLVQYRLGYCLDPALPEKTFCCTAINLRIMHLVSKEFGSNAEDFCENNNGPFTKKQIDRVKKMVEAIRYEQTPSLDSTIATASKFVINKKEADKSVIKQNDLQI